MDISGIKAITRKVELRHPVTQEPIGFNVWLLPLSDSKLKAIQRQQTNALMRNRKLTITAEKAEANRTDLLVAAIDRWEWVGDANFNGETPEFSAEAARKLLKVEWLRDQIDEALGDEASFFEA